MIGGYFRNLEGGAALPRKLNRAPPLKKKVLTANDNYTSFHFERDGEWNRGTLLIVQEHINDSDSRSYALILNLEHMLKFIREAKFWFDARWLAKKFRLSLQSKIFLFPLPAAKLHAEGSHRLFTESLAHFIMHRCSDHSTQSSTADTLGLFFPLFIISFSPVTLSFFQGLNELNFMDEARRGDFLPHTCLTVFFKAYEHSFILNARYDFIIKYNYSCHENAWYAISNHAPIDLKYCNSFSNNDAIDSPIITRAWRGAFENQQSSSDSRTSLATHCRHRSLIIDDRLFDNRSAIARSR